MTTAAYQVSDGGTVLGTVQQNQKLARFAGSYGGVYWADLGSFTINSGAVYVRVSANSSGSLGADGVLLVPSVTTTPSISLGGAKSVNATPIATIPATSSSSARVFASPATTNPWSISPPVTVAVPGISRNRLTVSLQGNRGDLSLPTVSVACKGSPPTQHSDENEMDELLSQLAVGLISTTKRTN